MDRIKNKVFGDSYSIIFPNLFTTGNLFCGFFSIINSLSGKYTYAAYLILAATLFDLLDGRVARMVKGVSVFGKEYDSLADLVSFGVAPAILAYLWTLSTVPKGWLISFLFVATGALRLARFNATSVTHDPAYFMGLPIPTAAAWIVSAFLFSTELGIGAGKNYFIIPLMLIASFLMVSNVKYKSYKKPQQDVKKGFFKNMVLFAILLVAFAASFEIVPFILISCYLLIGLFGYIFLRKKA